MGINMNFKVDLESLTKEELVRILNFFLSHGHIDDNLLYKSHAFITNHYLLEHIKNLTDQYNVLLNQVEQENTLNKISSEDQSYDEKKSSKKK